jgi:hypothetical protein
METSILVLNKLQETKALYDNIVKELDDEFNEAERIKARIIEIGERLKMIDDDVQVFSHKKECLDVLLLEIDVGYDKIVASSQCLSVLATRKLRMLKRKYSKLIRI